jgi:hypothetical protein
MRWLVWAAAVVVVGGAGGGAGGGQVEEVLPNCRAATPTGPGPPPLKTRRAGSIVPVPLPSI